MNDAVATYYDFWKNSYLKESQKTAGGYYIESGGTGGAWKKSTISSMHGWGMIIFSLMAGYDPHAQKYVDGMYKFFLEHPSCENHPLMSWQVLADESDSSDYSSAEGDFDIAYALMPAENQWGNDGDINYLMEARKMIINGANNGVKF